jgi:hypothetical protein
LLVLFILLAAGNGFLAITLGRRVAIINRINRGDLVAIAEVRDADNAVAGSAFIVGALSLAVFVVFVVWLWRAYSNIEPLGAGRRRWGRGWTIGAWFVPIANLIIPKQLVNDSWRAADEQAPGNPRWTELPVDPVITAWWLTFLISVVGVRALNANVNGHDIDAIRQSNIVGLFGSLVAIGACVLGLLAVRAITARQHRRAASLFDR